MNEKISQEKKIQSGFNQLWLDSLLSLTPDNTYLEAFNAVNVTDKESFFGLSNEPSNELFVNLPGQVRGLVYVEERNQYVVFIDNEAGGEIGIIDEKTHSYTSVTNTEIASEIGICQDQWIDCLVKVVQPCNNLYLYWSSGDIYKRINLDDPCCKFEEIPLIKPVSISAIKTDVVEKGGGLPNGIYQFAARPRDEEGNTGNPSRISNPVSVADGDFKAGERSGKAINIRIEGLDNRDYHIVDLFVISTIDNLTSVEQFATIGTSSSNSTLNYLYSGKTGREFPVQLSDILTRTNRYIRGKNLVQYDNRLVLYNLRPIANLDYQRQANEITAKYVTYVLPLEHADKYKGLRPNENYWFGIRWNYEDGTSSANFVIPGRDGGPDPCDPYQDNSVRENVYIEDLTDLGQPGSTTTPDDSYDVTYDPSQHESDILTEDESTAIELGPDDLPDTDGILDDLNAIENEFAANLDCLCDAARAIADKSGLGVFGGWDLDDDVIGAITVAQILCMCENRTVEGGYFGSRGSGGTITDNPPRDGDDEPVDEDPDEIDCEALSLELGYLPPECEEDPNQPILPPEVDPNLTFDDLNLTQDFILKLTGDLEGSDGTGCLFGNCADPLNLSVPADEERPNLGCNDGTCGNCNFPCTGSGCSNSSCTSYNGYRETPSSVTGRSLERSIRLAKNRVIYEGETFRDEARRTRSGDLVAVDVFQGGKCYKEGYKTNVGTTCYECKGGRWYQKSNTESYPSNSGYSSIPGGARDKEYGFENIYAADGCTIIGVKPRRFTDGLFGSWKTQETYPETLDCNCQPIYGDLAGQNVRLHKVPSVTKEPHFFSLNSGVPNKYDIGNSEFKDTYIILVGAEFDNITPPANPPKPLSKTNPYSITYVERTEGNKTVIGSALAHSCFLGEIGGEPHAFAKHALNSFERFDRSIEPAGVSSFRGGYSIDVGAYFVHSPDFHMRRPPLDATTCLIELEATGKGFRHGMFSQGELPESPSQDRQHQKGTRQSLNVNHYTTFGHPIVREVKAMSNVPADSILSKANRFTYSLCNLHRESGVYVELEGNLERFRGDDTPKYGGRDSNGDFASDRSFTGDVFTESLPIHNVKGHMMTFIRSLPSQYGSPISQVYVPLGLESEGFSPKISGLVGDSFSGPITYKRTALISDKTNRIIARFISVGGFDSATGMMRRFVGRLMASMFRALGLKNGGYIPRNQDSSDYIRVFGGLRFAHAVLRTATSPVDQPGEIQSGDVDPDRIPDHFPRFNETNEFTSMNNRSSGANDINFGDNYFPQNLKTQLTTYLNSDVNVHYRELGNVEAGEVYYSPDSSTLKGLAIDSSIPEDTKWQRGWLNRWYSEWKENAKWKLIVQGVILFLFVYAIGLWLIITGIGYVTLGLQAMGGGTYGLQSIGGALGATFGIIVAILGAAWMSYWVQVDIDNKFVEEKVGMKNLRPDRKNADGSYSFNENRLVGFENNYFRADSTHSRVNQFEISYGMPDPYNTCSCETIYTNEILYSNPQDPKSQIDFWRNFKPNNNLEIPLEHGHLTKMFRLGNTLYAHTTDMLMSLYRGGSQGLNAQNVLLGTGDLFGGASPIYGGVVEGYAGLSDPNAAAVSIYGYNFPDRKARTWFQLRGEAPQAISTAGVKHFMDENMTLELLNHFPSFKLVDLKLDVGIGFSHGVDHVNQRLLFTKRDFKPIVDGIKLNPDNTTFSLNGENIALGDPRYFENKCFTLSYSMRSEGWVSFHNYYPHLYAWNRHDMYSFNPEGIWIHNVQGSFQTFYGIHYPFSVEYAIRDAKTSDAFQYISTVLGTEAYQWKDWDYIPKEITFDKVMGYNSHQNTGLLDFIDTRKLDMQERSVENLSRVDLEYINRIWTYNGLVDKLISKDDFMFDPKTTVGPRPVNKNNISNTPSKNNILYDNYLVNRLIFSNFADVKLNLKRIETNIKYKAR